MLSTTVGSPLVQQGFRFRHVAGISFAYLLASLKKMYESIASERALLACSENARSLARVREPSYFFPCYVPGSVPVNCEVHYTNRCDDNAAWKCDIRCLGSFVPSVRLTILEVACPVCLQGCLCIRQSVKDYPGLLSASIVLYDHHYNRKWLGESHVLLHLRSNNSAFAFRPIFK